MGSALRRLARPLKNYNVESRAEKVISREKPERAPHFPAVEEALRNAPPVDPEPKKEVLESLKQVYVTSQDPVGVKSEDGRGLPQDRSYTGNWEYGYLEPKVIPRGKVSLRQALEFMQNNYQHPEKWTAENIANEYKLNVGLTEKVLQYFHIYEVFEPPSTKQLKPGEKEELIQFARPLKTLDAQSDPKKEDKT